MFPYYIRNLIEIYSLLSSNKKLLNPSLFQGIFYSTWMDLGSWSVVWWCCHMAHNCLRYWFNKYADWVKADRKCGEGYQSMKSLWMGRTKQRCHSHTGEVDVEDTCCYEKRYQTMWLNRIRIMIQDKNIELASCMSGPWVNLYKINVSICGNEGLKDCGSGLWVFWCVRQWF